MAREGLQAELRTAIHVVVSEGLPTINKELSVKTNGDFSIISFSLCKQANPDASDGILLLSFQDVATTFPGKAKPRLHTSESSAQLRINTLEHELANTKETLHATIEAQLVNNEELETSKEELQLVNEELIAVNAELQSKIEQLFDMQNLLNDVSVGIIFLDQHMHIRRFTREATRIYRLAQSDVGRHFGDIKSDLECDDLLVSAQNVLNSLVPYEREMRTAHGTWCLARIQPYRSLDNVINGVVLTFTDITQRVDVIALQGALEIADGILNAVREPLLVLDSNLQVVAASLSLYHTFKVQANEVMRRPVYELGNRQWDTPALRTLLKSVFMNAEVFENHLIEHDFSNIGHRRMLLNARRIPSKIGHAQLILLAMKEMR